MVEVVHNPPLSRKKNDADRAYPLPNSAFGKDRLSTKLALSAAIFRYTQKTRRYAAADKRIHGAIPIQCCDNGDTRSRIPLHFRNI